MNLSRISLAITRPRMQMGVAGAAMALDFVSGNETLDSRVTFTRSTAATRFNRQGALETAAIDGPRFDWDPVTLSPRGLLIEEARTNSIRNSTMAGAVAGTPGTLPTRWLGSTNPGGLTREVVGVGTEDGIPYLDVRYSGTTSALLSNSTALSLEAINGTAAASGQTWTHSAYLRLVAGSLPAGGAIGVRVNETDGTTILALINNPVVPTAAALRTQRFVATRTFSSATTTFAQPAITLTLPNNTLTDFTVRVGAPQLEQGAFATSFIPTSTVAVQRTADQAVMTGTNFSSWYNAVEGTLFAEAAWISPESFKQIANISDGTANNIISAQTATAPSARANVIVGGVSQSAITVGNFSVGVTAKIVNAYKTNDFAACLNGGTVAADTSGTVPTVTQMSLGTLVTTTSNIHIRRIAYFPRRLANSELQALTG